MKDSILKHLAPPLDGYFCQHEKYRLRAKGSQGAHCRCCPQWLWGWDPQPSLGFCSAPALQHLSYKACGAAGPGLSAAPVFAAQTKMRRTDPEKFRNGQRSRKTPTLRFKKKRHHPPVLPCDSASIPCCMEPGQGFVQGRCWQV